MVNKVKKTRGDYTSGKLIADENADQIERILAKKTTQ
jgi:hypothetical protein